ncbi:Uncharacterised protein [Bordetella pertussis]|nr:Uncharacterised protein [Bordetella pertussis]
MAEPSPSSEYSRRAGVPSGSTTCTLRWAPGV